MTATERGAVACLCGAVVLGPLVLGATGAWPRFAIEAAMAAAGILWAAAERRPWWLTGLPVVVASLALLQLVPLPDRLLMTIAPVSAGAWKVALAGDPAAWGRISVDPAATAVAACRLLLGLVTVAVVADLARRPTARAWLSGAMACSAVVIVALGVAFPVTKKDRILLGFIDLKGPVEYWRDPVAAPVETSGWAYLEPVSVSGRRYRTDLGVAGDGFGSYVSSNAFAAGVYLTLPVLCAVVLAATRRRLPAPLAAAIAAGLLAAGVWVVVALAGSRAGGAALVFAAIVYLSLALEARWPRRIATVAAAISAVAIAGFVVLFLGEFKGVSHLLPAEWQPRLMALLTDGRTGASYAALRMFRASPVLGTGLATYGDLYPRVVRNDLLLYYAHNDYAQLLAETGLVGACVLLPLAVALGVGFWRFRRASSIGPVTTETCLAAGAWAALAGIVAHSAFDWNLHVPANALLTSVVAGLALASVRPCAPAPARRRPLDVAAALLLGAATLGALACVGRDAASASVQRTLRHALTMVRSAPVEGVPPERTEALAAAIALGERMAAWDPANGRLSVLIGQAYLHRMVVPQPIDVVDGLRQSAEARFLAARRSDAALLGLPEPEIAP